MICTRCQGTGFLNFMQLPAWLHEKGNATILRWIDSHPHTNVQVCDCCGDGKDWYGEPGHHYAEADPPGPYGPYASNGGLCQCH